MSRITDDCLERGKARGKSDAERERKRKWIAATERLCANEDFRVFLFDVLDDFSFFARGEGMRSEFGMGITASANRIKNRILEAKGAVEMLSEFARRDYAASHKRLVEAQQENTETEDDE